MCVLICLRRLCYKKTKTFCICILHYNGFGWLRLIMTYFVSFTCKVIYMLSKYYLSATEFIFCKYQSYHIIIANMHNQLLYLFESVFNKRRAQDEISPFSRLNGDWIVTGKVDFSRISATIQLPFSRLNGRHISVTFQSAYFFDK